jgi:hypothetical protein
VHLLKAVGLQEPFQKSVHAIAADQREAAESHRPISLKRMEQPARAIASGVAPLTYAAATMDPALTPVTQ